MQESSLTVPSNDKNPGLWFIGDDDDDDDADIDDDDDFGLAATLTTPFRLIITDFNFNFIFERSCTYVIKTEVHQRSMT